MIHKITNWLSGEVIIEIEADSLRVAAEIAVGRGASLDGANLVGASLDGAIGVIDAGSPDGWRCVGWMRGSDLIIKAGCRDKTVAEAREYWSGEPDRAEILAAVDYIVAVAKLRGWPA